MISEVLRFNTTHSSRSQGEFNNNFQCSLLYKLHARFFKLCCFDRFKFKFLSSSEHLIDFNSVSSKPQDVVVKIDETEEVDEDDFASKEHHILVELFQALWYVVLSHTDFICYAMVFLNQVKTLKFFT